MEEELSQSLDMDWTISQNAYYQELINMTLT